MFGIGTFELVIILIFGFLIFGPDKLPAIAKTVAQALNKFKSAQEEMSKVIKTEVYDPNSDEPFKNPLETLSKITGSDKKPQKTESFTERKAKYDKERESQKRAEERKKAAASQVAAGTEGQPVEKPSEEIDADAKKPAEKAKPTAAELYGNAPKAAAAKKTTVEKSPDDAHESANPKPMGNELSDTKLKSGQSAGSKTAEEKPSAKNPWDVKPASTDEAINEEKGE